MDAFSSKYLYIFSNQMPHPERKGYLVYHFRNKDEADYFEELLIQKKLFYERAEETNQLRITHLFGVKSVDVDEIDAANYLTKAKFRTFMVANKFLRYSLILLGIAIVAFAFVGFFSSKD